MIFYITRFDYYNFFLSTYDNPAHARQALYAGVSSSYLLSLVSNQSTYLGHAIKADYTKLNQALSPLANFNATIYLGWVQARWGQGIFSSMASSLVYTQQLKLNEQHLYGSSRLGVKTPDTTLFNRDITISGIDSMGQLIVQNILDSSILVVDTANYSRILALKQYELSNHLGNVLATVLDRRTMTSDKVLAYQTTFTGTTDGWTAGWSAAGTIYSVTPPTTVAQNDNRLQCTATVSMGGVRKVIATTIGTAYTFSVDIDMGTAEGLYIMPRTTNGSNEFTGTNLAQVYLTSSGTYVVNFTATTSTTQLLIEKAGSVEKYFYIDNVKVEQSTPTLSSYPIADVVGAQYYYPYHSTMKSFKAGENLDYAFGGANGQEKDNEIFNGAYGALFWEYDSRLGGNGRWNVDPKTHPSFSPYATFFNNPISFIDTYGDSSEYYDSKGNKLHTSYDKLPNSVVIIPDANLVAFKKVLNLAKTKYTKALDGYRTNKMFRGFGVSYLTDDLQGFFDATKKLTKSNGYFEAYDYNTGVRRTLYAEYAVSLVLNEDGYVTISNDKRTDRNFLFVHPDGLVNKKQAVAFLHTHPNLPGEYELYRSPQSYMEKLTIGGNLPKHDADHEVWKNGYHHVTINAQKIMFSISGSVIYINRLTLFKK